MIDFVKGQVIYNQTNSVTIEINGIGYRTYIPSNLAFDEGENLFLYTHLVIREDAHSLYGFPTIEERDLFRLLLEVSGVGPKVGLAILSSGSPKELVTAVQLENVKFLTKMPGIGKKTAQRMILELKDKLKKLEWDSKWKDLPDHQDVASQRRTPMDQEAVEALMGLGYNEDEASQAVQFVLQSENRQSLSMEELIKRALQASMKR